MSSPADDVLDFAAAPALVRKLFGAMLATMPVPEGARIVPAKLSGLEGLEITSPGVAADAALLYIHGGGYIAGSADGLRGLAAALGKAAGVTAYSMDYRLAPENPCPAALEDAISAYQGLLAKGYSPARLVVGGESSGGGLALAMLVALRESGIALPAATYLISPWADLALRSPSVRTKAKADPMLTERGLMAAAAHYLGGTPAHRPDASPIYADLRGLPPTIIHAGSIELLLDDAVRTAGALASADVDVTLHVWPKLPHAFQVMGRQLPAAEMAIAEVGAFLKARIAGNDRRPPP